MNDTDPRERRGRFEHVAAPPVAADTGADAEQRRTDRYLHDLAERAEDAAFTASVGREAFLAESTAGRQTRRSARMLIVEVSTILHERLPQSYRDAHPDVPWREIAGMRNRATHVYDGIDDEIVWDVLTVEIPALVRLLGIPG